MLGRASTAWFSFRDDGAWLGGGDVRHAWLAAPIVALTLSIVASPVVIVVGGTAALARAGVREEDFDEGKPAAGAGKPREPQEPDEPAWASGASSGDPPDGAA